MSTRKKILHDVQLRRALHKFNITGSIRILWFKLKQNTDDTDNTDFHRYKKSVHIRVIRVIRVLSEFNATQHSGPTTKSFRTRNSIRNACGSEPGRNGNF